jgi:DNA-binding LytR/AlgR family response regulator
MDDEPLAVTRLTAQLSRFNDVDLVGTATESREGLKLIEGLRPDVVFMDIEMPIMDGFDLIQSLAQAEGPAPLFVFVTAYPKFAVSAFETGAVDFLTKPVNFGRLSACFDRIREALQNQIARVRLKELLAQLEELRLRGTGNSHSQHRYLWVHRRGEAIRVDLDRLGWISAEGEYVRLHAGDAEYLHRGSITAIAGMLDEAKYLRVHRSHIVRIDRVTCVQRRRTGSYSLVLDSGVTLPVGRQYRKIIRLFAMERPTASSGHGTNSV